MNATDISLTATTGRQLGSSSSRRLRATGEVPAVVYGLDGGSVAVSVAWPELRRALSTEAGRNALINLEIDGTTALSIVTDIQRHPVRRDVIHVDFLRIDPDAPLTVEVPVVLTGRSEALEHRKGMVDQLMYTVAVLARPGSIPNQVEGDISGLEIGTSLTVADLPLPDGVTAAVDGEEVVAVGSPTRSTVIMEQEAARAARIAAGEATEEDLAAEAAAGEGGAGDAED